MTRFIVLLLWAVSLIGATAAPEGARQLRPTVEASSATGSQLEGAIGTAIEGGRANYANPSHGSDYLAIRSPRGTLVRICGDGGCWTTRSNDYGPVEATGDIALVQFARICNYTIAEAKLHGECDVTLEYLAEGPRMTLPPTDTIGEGNP